MPKGLSQKSVWILRGSMGLIIFIGLFGGAHASSFPAHFDRCITVQDTIPALALDSNELPPEPVGGYEAYHKYIKKNYKTPKAVRRSGRVGTISIRFVIEADGSLTEMKAIRTLGEGTGEEGIRVIKEGPKWKPGMQNGKPVRILFTYQIPVNRHASLQMEDRERQHYQREQMMRR